MNINELKPGITFQHNHDIFLVISSQNSKQGRGQVLVKTKVRNLRTGSSIPKTFTSKDKIKPANIQKKKMTFLYVDQQYIFLMDETTYKELKIPLEKIQWEKNFLTSNSLIIVKKFKKEILGIELPSNVELEVIYSPDAVKGNTHNNAYKKVKLETDFELDVPMFIKQKDVISVSTKDGKYMGKVNK